MSDNTCKFKPQGIIGCAIYSDETTCLKCRDNQYVVNDQCHKVDEDNLIENCLYYKDNITCGECDNGYFLTDNKCKAITISDCQILRTESTCDQCVDNYFMSEIFTC